MSRPFNDFMLITNETDKSEVEKIWQSYLSGEPFFTKEKLEEIDKILTEIHDNSYYTIYSNVQQVVQNSIEHGINDLKPVFISNFHSTTPVLPMETNAKALYQSSRKEWMGSQLKAQLDAITFPASINKIVCFGLGPPSSPHEHGRRRSNIQHAAVESIMENLKRNSDIYCYAQDPAYVDIDKEVLKSIGIETIEDPKGFLEIDENTFIISISPNVPVRQIVSDLQRPAAMLWDTVGSMKDEKENWDKALKGQSAWTTEPDSPRLRKLVENYAEHRLQDDLQVFGNVTLYIRK